jgi:hypothetical protein
VASAKEIARTKILLYVGGSGNASEISYGSLVVCTIEVVIFFRGEICLLVGTFFV